MVNPSEAANPLLAFSNSLADAVAQAGNSVVAVNARRRASSSGVYWQAGLVVTADHTIRREEEMTVTLPDGQTLPVTLVGRDAGSDLAVLKLSGEMASIPLTVPAVAAAASLRLGHLVLAIARASDASLSTSLGVLSTLGGSWRTWQGGQIDQFIRPALSVYPGFSGGPLVDSQGQVLGINISGRRGIVLTIPAATVNQVVNQLLHRGRIARGYLGIGMQAVQLPDSLKTSLNLTGGSGVIIVSVESGSPADQAGVLIGDVLIALGERPVSDVQDIQAMLDPEQVGQPLNAQIVRGGALMSLTLTVGERPQGRC